ncbi:prorelaxin [Phodopus roborovskii]|uniref:Rln1 protein n=1 Tax=Phodopus roborovskii TaxID=109678 RepID=A0AAU9ZWS0_PHORO|nr:prorelaxin [Phodopus roborovskii]CAH6966889.1 Rln1 [Phodopus roborovskii]
MSCRFVLQLLGFWLLLSQPCRARVSKEWLDQVIKVCGREYVRAIFEICAASVGLEESAPRHKRMTDTVPSLIKEDAEPFDMMPKRLPDLTPEPKAAVSDGHPSLPEQQEYVPGVSDSVGTQGEDSNPPELESLHLDTHSRKKRYAGVHMSHQCCYRGCSRRSLIPYC